MKIFLSIKYIKLKNNDYNFKNKKILIFQLYYLNIEIIEFIFLKYLNLL
jgi:hypothetical protein